MATPVSTSQLRHALPPAAAAARDRFAVLGWTRWPIGILPWLFVFYYAYPILWRASHGTLTPLPPRMWAVGALFLVFVFVALPAVALLAGWIAFVVLRVEGDRIMVGRWFGAWRRVYTASELGGWHFVDRRSRRVADVKRASMLWIDFLDGSWVNLPRYAWNFRTLHQWLRSSNVGSPQSRFVVRAPGTTILGLVGWSYCWFIGALFLTETLSGKRGEPSGLGEVALYGLGVVMMGIVPVIAGPLCAHLLLQVVRIDASRIQVDRWFGLVRRTYHEGDIASWRLRVESKPPRGCEAQVTSVRLLMVDGASVFVTARATNFRLLHDFLRDRVPSRQTD